MKIAIDAMGGDYAPAEVVKGAVRGARECGAGIFLVGQQDRIKAELDKQNTAGLDIEVIHTDEYLVAALALVGQFPINPAALQHGADHVTSVGEVAPV